MENIKVGDKFISKRNSSGYDLKEGYIVKVDEIKKNFILFDNTSLSHQWFAMGKENVDKYLEKIR